MENMKNIKVPSHYEFLKNSEDTGRMIVHSTRTGRTYFIEPMYDGKDTSDWGSIVPATGDVVNKKGHGKHRGAIKKSESMIDEEMGFKNIHLTDVGESPFCYIDKLEEKYLALKG